MPGTLTLDAGLRSTLVEETLSRLREYYVFPDLALSMDAARSALAELEQP